MSSSNQLSGADIDWSKIPSAYPPAGSVQDLINPYSQRSSIWVTSSICTLVVTLAVFARLYTKVWLVRAVHLEDYLLAASWASFVIGVPFFCLEAWQGAGTHQWDVTMAQSFELMKLVNIGEAIYCVNVAFAKLAILVQMKRVLALSTKNLVYWLIVILICTILAFYTAAFILVIFACVPREKLWQPWLNGTCRDEVLGDLIAGIFNLGTDVLMLLLPIFAILKLGITLKQRLLVCAVFSTGLLACMFSILRVYYGHILLYSLDRTYDCIAASCVSMGECAALTIIICFPTIRLLILHLLGKATIQPQQTRSESMQQLRVKVMSPVSTLDDERSSSSLSKVSDVYRGNEW